MGSVTTGYPTREEHLLSPGFFDAANHPRINFKRTGAESLGGPLCREITIGFAATGKINREDYEISWNETMPGGVGVDKEVKITLDVEADLITE